jgi:hypothetical protein
MPLQFRYIIFHTSSLVTNIFVATEAIGHRAITADHIFEYRPAAVRGGIVNLNVSNVCGTSTLAPSLKIQRAARKHRMETATGCARRVKHATYFERR